MILISFDAFRADYIDRFNPPALTRLASRGVRAASLIPSFPSKTFPNHYSIVTGLYPGNHGIVGNTFFDPSRKAWYRLALREAVEDGSWYGGEPIWATAERNGVKSGSFFWAGSEAAIDGVRPSYWRIYDDKVPHDDRVNTVVSWLRKPGPDRPHLVLAYFSVIDDTTHRYGPDAPQTAIAVAEADRVLRLLMDSVDALPIRDSVNYVIVSDHGMFAISGSRVIPALDALVAAGVDTAGIRMSDNGPTFSFWFNGDTARMRQAFPVLRRLDHAETYLRADIPERFHVRQSARIGDILMVAEEGWTLQRRATDRMAARGAHGWDPLLPSMRAIFVAAGPNVRSLGVLAPFENVHIYPFLTALLRLPRVPAVDGNAAVLSPALR